MKEWTIEIYLLDEEGNEHPAKCFNKVTYHLHPSFAQPVQSKPVLHRIVSVVTMGGSAHAN